MLLLGAGLNVLHQERREWQETIAFRKDETKFFTDLLRRKETKESEYERLLSRLIQGEKGLSDGKYREKHRKLGERIALFTNDFREFKKMFFGYAKKL
ncbi:MAG: hypothetical protein ACJAU2_000368 [Maribacter sp.]